MPRTVLTLALVLLPLGLEAGGAPRARPQAGPVVRAGPGAAPPDPAWWPVVAPAPRLPAIEAARRPRRVAMWPVLAIASGPPGTAEAWRYRGHRRAPRVVPARQAARWTVPPHAVKVQDGDTFYVGAEAIRLRGIDAPEVGEPGAEAATWRLAALLGAGPVTIVRRGEDVYGRTLADVFAGGRDAARTLRDEGHAKPRPRAGRVR
jgi:micrococcal nuclease